MLKLVVSNAEPGSAGLSQPIISPSSDAPFSSQVQVQGPHLYLMTTQDPSHNLSCELILEVEESREEWGAGTVICHFPHIEAEQLADLIHGDETLYGIIMIQFQMKVLEQLLLFCATNYATKLIIYADDTHADEFDIYREFLSYEGQALAQNGDQTEMIIPADPETFDNWIDFMDEVTLKFRQTLWQDQRVNPTIKQYLKIHPLG